MAITRLLLQGEEDIAFEKKIAEFRWQRKGQASCNQRNKTLQRLSGMDANGPTGE